MILLIITPHDGHVEVNNVSFISYSSNVSTERHAELEGISIGLLDQVLAITPKGASTLSLDIPVRINVTKSLTNIRYDEVLGEIQVSISFKDAVSKKMIEKKFITEVVQSGNAPTIPIP